MNRYNPLAIEAKWQKIWEDSGTFKADNNSKKPKKSITEIFPRPSRANLHVGHARNYTTIDVLTRYYSQKGYNVLQPFGYDTFDLPAEKSTNTSQSATVNFLSQLKKLGYAIDWSRETETSLPDKKVQPYFSQPYDDYTNTPNVLDPLNVINDGYGADTLRTYEMFIGPYNKDVAWDPRSVGAIYHFLNRCWTLVFEKDSSKKSKNLNLLNKTIKKVTDDIERASFNTAISALMKYVNALYKIGASAEDLITLAKLLKPFAPHLASEMLEQLKSDDTWPEWNEKYLVTDTVEIIVQVNGKLRAKIKTPTRNLADCKKIEKLALANLNVQKYVPSKPKKIVYVQKAHLINLVV